MVFFSGKLIIEPRMENPTLVILTDRNDLGRATARNIYQLPATFKARTTKSRRPKDLRKLLKVASGGIVFTTIQKFMPMQTDIVQTEKSKYCK
jgi:type I restriction enzyme, R subunit